MEPSPDPSSSSSDVASASISQSASDDFSPVTTSSDGEWSVVRLHPEEGSSIPNDDENVNTIANVGPSHADLPVINQVSLTTISSFTSSPVPFDPNSDQKQNDSHPTSQVEPLSKFDSGESKYVRSSACGWKRPSLRNDDKAAAMLGIAVETVVGAKSSARSRDEVGADVQRTDSSSDFDPSDQSSFLPPLYAADFRKSHRLYFYYRWVNPWIRMLFIFPVLYVYAMSSGILTYRQDTYVQPLEAEGVIAPDTHPTSIPGFRPFILRDLGFDFIPAAAEYGTRDNWVSFANATPIIFNIVMFLILIARRDVIRITEYIGIQMIMFGMNALCHVVTTLPDPNGYGAACSNAEYQHWGNWVFYDITTTYCGDLIWSGHTANTLLPLIIIRRTVWDYLGWNFNTKYEKQQPDGLPNWDKYDAKQAKEKEVTGEIGQSNPTLLHRSPSLVSLSADNAEDRYTYFYHLAQFHSQNHLMNDCQHAPIDSHRFSSFPSYNLGGQPSSVASTAPSSTANTPKRGSALTHVGPSDQILERMEPSYRHTLEKGTMRMEQLNDDQVLHPHDMTDVHIPIQATQIEAGKVNSNYDHDIFLHRLHSPYTTPCFVMNYHNWFVSLVWLIRLLLPAWFTVLLFAILVIRFHYTVDIVLACIVTCLVAGNARLVQWFVRMIYRPYYHNYAYNHWWKPVYLSWPLNKEQINYEERVRRVALAGYF